MIYPKRHSAGDPSQPEGAYRRPIEEELLRETWFSVNGRELREEQNLNNP